MLMPAVCRKSSPVKCCVAPKPGLAKEIFPGLALAAATNCLTSSAGKTWGGGMVHPPDRRPAGRYIGVLGFVMAVLLFSAAGPARPGLHQRPGVVLFPLALA